MADSGRQFRRHFGCSAMDSIGVSPAAATEEAIRTINGFLRATEDDHFELDAVALRRLSEALSIARSARSLPVPVADSHYETLQGRYRESLECLKQRLARLDLHLQRERGILLDQQAQLSRTRDWHELFSRTQ